MGYELSPDNNRFISPFFTGTDIPYPKFGETFIGSRNNEINKALNKFVDILFFPIILVYILILR